MNLCSKKIILKLLKKYQAWPKKRLGQNFLIDQEIIKKMVFAADLSKKDRVLEIGPGIGALTQKLAKSAKEVVAVEKDKKMVEILKQTLKDQKNIKIIQKDILEFEPKFKNYKIVSNLPYFLTAPVIRKFLEAKFQPQLMVVLIQKEVAQRICQKPPNLNLLALSVQVYGSAKIVDYVKKKSFFPPPQVEGAILKISNLFPLKNRVSFFKIARAGFLHPRKTLLNNLTQGLKIDKKKVELWLKKNKISPQQRAQSLTLKDWQRLSQNFWQLF
jgi:16S rRNA (adenine1518-N6/adenine1519-N6)-dimethyltransferase